MTAIRSSTEVLQAAFPGRVALNPREIAQAIYGAGKDTRKRIEQVNRALNEGRLVPGLRKSGPRWLVPIAALGKALDRQVAAVPAEDVGAERRRPGANMGPRMLFQHERSQAAFMAILNELERLDAQVVDAQMESRTAPALGPSKPIQRP